jgi:arylformamidase
MGKIYDITVEMREDMPFFPGDEKVFELTSLLNVAMGDDYSIKKLSMLTHSGTHLDAPSHFIPDGKNLDEMPLSTFIGTAQVININDDEKIDIDALKNIEIEPGMIILFKTKNSMLWKENKSFVANYVYITPAAAQWLVDHRIRLVGIDYLSADKYDNFGDSKTHQILLGNEVPILEGINLSEVFPGRYHLTCLPLKIKGLDGSPVRAILEEFDR